MNSLIGISVACYNHSGLAAPNVLYTLLRMIYRLLVRTATSVCCKQNGVAAGTAAVDVLQ
jgi:hypothetical protein